MTVTHHLYQHSADLWPACGVGAGPKADDPSHWHTGDEATLLLMHLKLGHHCCLRCVQLARRELIDSPRSI